MASDGTKQTVNRGASGSSKRLTVRPRYRVRTSPELLQDAQDIFSKYAGTPVSERETQEMLGNLTRFTLLLERWKREELQERRTGKPGKSGRR